MNEYNVSHHKKRAYGKPELVSYGSLKAMTHTNQGGPSFDGGTNPRHKGPVVTGGTFNIDPDFYDDSGSGSSQNNDIFE